MPPSPATTTAAAAAALFAFALSGCATATSASTSYSGASQPFHAAASAPASLSAADHPQAPGGPTSPGTLGVAWDGASKTAALDVATQAMTLYARPRVSAQAWIRDLRPLLTPQAAQDYADADPSTIEIASFGTGELVVDEANGYGAKARFGSPQGPYEVVLHRDGAEAPWKVVRFDVPGSR